jgi:acetyltransferase-like isoleucine patch superfamily enzyme
MTIRIHASAEVSDKAIIGDGTSIWHQSQVREEAQIGQNCILGKGVYIDTGVCLGDNVKIQNYVSVFHGVTIEDGVFIGPHVCFTNDLRPRAINPDGTIKAADDWVLSETLIKYGAAIGANSTVRCGVTIGEWAMIGSGSVITKDVPAYGLVVGNPAKLVGFVCPCGVKLNKTEPCEAGISMQCPKCGLITIIASENYSKLCYKESTR